MDSLLFIPNQTQLIARPGPFVLIGILGLEASKVWLFASVCLLHMAALARNALPLWLVVTDKALQAPMYQLLGLLATTDLILVTSTVPKALAVLWDLPVRSLLGLV